MKYSDEIKGLTQFLSVYLLISISLTCLRVQCGYIIRNVSKGIAWAGKIFTTCNTKGKLTSRLFKMTFPKSILK